MMKRERAKRERAAKQTRRKRGGKVKKYFTHVISEYPPGTFDCPASTVEPGMP